jgi:long-subunit acyl-CoA synthetase (AMP-forming)
MKLLLEYAYERERTDRPWLTQPMGGGAVRHFTWREAMAEARKMASHLKSLNLPPKSSIGILSKNCAHWILADLAIWMAGHVSVPLYPTLTAASVRQILEHSEARLLFVGKLDIWETMKAGVPESLPMVGMPLGPEVGQAWDTLVAAQAPLAGEPSRAPDELATLVYTSGSTGVPKGVMINFAAMAAYPTAFQMDFETRDDDRILSHLPMAHVAERAIVECGSFVYGTHIYFAESLETFVEDLKRARPTLFFTVPRLYQKFQIGVFAKMPPKKLERLLSIPIVSRLVRRKILSALGLENVRLAGAGASPMPPELLTWYRRLGLELLEGYGMTENFGLSHTTRPGRVRAGYVGEPLPGVEQRISAEGEVQVRSPGTMMGYYKAPELTSETLTDDGWLRTGDRGELDELGRLRITGRVKELFKTSKGKYVAPAPIENKLANHPLVEAVCVTGASQPQPFALVMLGAEAKKQARAEVEAALASHLQAVNATLDPHEALHFLAVVRDEWLTANGFLTPSMKIKRHVIEETYAPHVAGWYAADQRVLWQS